MRSPNLARLSVAAAALALACGWSGSAQARNVFVTAPMVPFLNKYAGCVFDRSERGAADQIAACQPLRHSLESDAEAVLPYYHRGSLALARRRLATGLDSVEQQAREVEKGRQYVTAPIVAYLDCVGTQVLASNDFRTGVAIDYRATKPLCEPVVLPEDQPGLTDAGRKRAWNYYRTVRLQERVNAPAATEPQFIGFNLQYGILGLTRYQPSEPQPDRFGQ